MTRRCIICDIDGTLANTDHRKHFLECRPKNWDGWHGAADADTPHIDVMVAVASISRVYAAAIILCSGRNESHRVQTVAWMATHNFRFDAFYMRADEDRRPDFIIKRELLDRIRADGFEPVIVFDDRSSVVKMWREAGIRCFQVAPGEF